MPQDTYIALPNGSYVQIPQGATPEQLSAFRERLRSFSKASKQTESAQVATRPDATAQARATVAKPITGKPAFAPSVPTIDKEDNLTDTVMHSGLDPKNRFTDPEQMLAAAQKANAPEPRPQGFLRNMLWEEPKAIAKGLGERSDGVAGYTPPNLSPAANAIDAAKTGNLGEAVLSGVGQVPVVGPMISARGKQAEADKWGALGASITDILAQALPFAMGDEKGLEKVTAKQGAKALADSIAEKDMSPGQYGASLQEGFDHISDAAGAAKREVVSRIEKEAPHAIITYPNTIKELELQVNNLKYLKSRNPSLFTEEEGPLNKTLRILEDELTSTRAEAQDVQRTEAPAEQRKADVDSFLLTRKFRATPFEKATTNISKADARRSQYYTYKNELDPSMASQIIGRLNKALTDDVKEGVGNVNPKLAEDYIGTSNRYRQLQEIARTDTLKNVFGDERVVPDKVVNIMNQAPEESLKAIRTLYKENPAAVQQLRRSIFEYGANKGSLRKMQPSVIREVFGPQAEAVNHFIEATNPLSAPSNPILAKLPGKLGAGVRFIVSASKDQAPIYISGAEMAKILKSSNITRMMTQAAKMSADSGPASMMRKMIVSSLAAAGIRPEAQEAAR